MQNRLKLMAVNQLIVTTCHHRAACSPVAAYIGLMKKMKSKELNTKKGMVQMANKLTQDGSTYYSGEQYGQCRICGEFADVREQFCFPCADAQAIIGTGSDMYDRTAEEYVKWKHPKGDGVQIPAEQADKRIKLLIKNGWKPPRQSDS